MKRRDFVKGATIMGIGAVLWNAGCKGRTSLKKSVLIEEGSKHLFRVQYTDPKNAEEEYVQRIKGYSVSDEVLSQHLSVHVLDVPMSKCKGTNPNGRDMMVEWGDTLFVNPKLVNSFLIPFSSHTFFQEYMESLGYDKKILGNKVLAEGGLHLFGKEFILVSDHYADQARRFRRIVKNCGVDQPIHFMPSSDQWRGHIDSDYLILDSLRLIGYDEDNQEAKSCAEKIAKKHDYEARGFKYPEMKCEEPEDAYVGLMKVISMRHGLNAIINDNTIFTGAIHDEDKNYLEERGLEVIVVPIGILDPGAGLRCVYGEFRM